MTGEIGQPAFDLGAPLPQSGYIDDPYPLLAAARRKGPVQTESPFGATSEGARSFHVLGYDEVVAVLWASPAKPDNRHAASWLIQNSSNSIGDM
jgi:hypothetical protein